MWNSIGHIGRSQGINSSIISLGMKIAKLIMTLEKKSINKHGRRPLLLAMNDRSLNH